MPVGETWILLISSRLFSRCAGTVESRGVVSLVKSQTIFVVGLFVLETIGRILMVGPVFCVLIRW